MAAGKRNIPDRPEPEWDDVERIRSCFEPWTEDRLVHAVDSLEQNVATATRYVDKSTA